MGRRQGGKGTGLGLALIRQIVQLSKGRLGVNSQYGKGSEFWFELPYAINPKSHARGPNSQSTSTGVSDATAVEPLDTSEKTLKSAGSEPPVPTLNRQPQQPLSRGVPLERQMTAEQFLVSGPPDRDSTSPRNQRGYFPKQSWKSGSRSKLVAPAAHRRGSGNSLPDARSQSPFGDMDLKRVSSTRSRIHEVNRPRFVPPKSDPPSPRSTSPHPRRSEEGRLHLPKQAVVTSPLSLVPPPQTTGRIKDPDKPEEADKSEANGRAATAAHDFAKPNTKAEPILTPGSILKSETDAPSLPAGPPNDDSSPLNVLIVDDDKLTRMMMARMLKRLGHLVETAENGQIALDKISDAFHLVEGSVAVDVVFLDK